jgi:hypothetical protein
MTPEHKGIGSAANAAGRTSRRVSIIEEAIFARVSGDAFPSAGDGDAEYVAGLRAAL